MLCSLITSRSAPHNPSDRVLDVNHLKIELICMKLPRRAEPTEDRAGKWKHEKKGYG